MRLLSIQYPIGFRLELRADVVDVPVVNVWRLRLQNLERIPVEVHEVQVLRWNVNRYFLA